eukprot:546267_1
MNSEVYIARHLRKTDYDKGYLQLLAQLTSVGNVSRELFDKTFDRMAASNIHVFVIEENNKIVACASLVIEQKFIHHCAAVGHIEDVVCDSTLRGKGLGKKITVQCVTYARNYGCYKAELDCSDHNVPFYEKCGFEKKENQMVIYIIKTSKL